MTHPDIPGPIPSGRTLQEAVEATATAFGIPGMAAGILHAGDERTAAHGVTSIENPVPVDGDTLFLLGSVSKTYTATAVLRLVADGRVELDAPVRRYVPDLRLADPVATSAVTVRCLLNHTSGLDWGLVTDTGEGDAALADYVARLGELRQLAPVGTRVSYSQAGYNLAGRLVETVTGMTFERAVATLVLRPLGMAHSFYARDDVMTRRFTVGHNRSDDGTLSVARLWRRGRGDNPGGGLASSVRDQLGWARFHLGDGRAADGTPVLPSGVLASMREPTAPLRGSNMGDAVGLGWFLRGIGGVRAAGHGGSANGQFAELLILPDRRFAVVVLSNAGPDGIPANLAVVRWALRTCLGLIDADPVPSPPDAARDRELVGTYRNEVMTLWISRRATALWLEVRMKPEIRAGAETELPPDHAPFPFGVLPGGTDEYVITGGAFAGQRGYFTRDRQGRIVGVDLAGRLFERSGADT